MSEPKRYIVEVWDDMTAEQAFYRCMIVARSGLISETAGRPHHCAVTTFADGTRVDVFPNAKSERFRVYKTTPRRNP